MTPEFWAVIAVGVALAALTLNGHRRLNERLDRNTGAVHKRMDRLEERMGRLEERMDRHTKELGERIGRVEVGVGEVRERVAYVEGLLEGLRDALVGKGLPEPPRPRRVGG